MYTGTFACVPIRVWQLTHDSTAWKAVEDESGVQLVHKTGALVFGPKTGTEVSKVRVRAVSVEEAWLIFSSCIAVHLFNASARYPSQRHVWTRGEEEV